MPFCGNCGNSLLDDAAICFACGNPVLRPEVAQLQVAAFLAAGPSGARPPSVYRLSFHGEWSRLLFLYLKTFLLSIITLGAYSFWGRAEIRRYIHGQTELEGHRFAYHGTGWELAKGALKILFVIVVLILQNSLWIYVLGAVRGQVVGTLLSYVMATLLAPFALVGAWRYRLSRTSYRGIRFGFCGTVKALFPVYLKGVFFTLITLTIYAPVFLANLRRFHCQNARYGNAGFNFDGNGTELIGSYIWSRLFAIPTLGIALLWYRVVRFRFDWNYTTFQGARFKADVTTVDMFVLLFTNLLITVFTLGLGSAWAKVRYLRYVTNSMLIYGIMDIALVAQFSQDADAAGETLSDFLDVEGIDLGL